MKPLKLSVHFYLQQFHSHVSSASRRIRLLAPVANSTDGRDKCPSDTLVVIYASGAGEQVTPSYVTCIRKGGKKKKQGK